MNLPPLSETGETPAALSPRDIIYPSALPVCAGSRGLFSAPSGRKSDGRLRPSALRFTGCAFSRSGPATTATSLTAPTRRAGDFSSFSPRSPPSQAQKSVLWWAAKHRQHHLHSDTPQDVHSPAPTEASCTAISDGFSTAIMKTTDLAKVADFAQYPELMWLHRNELAPAVALAILCFAVAGLQGLARRVLLEHRRGLSCDVQHQFDRACRRTPTIRHRRQFAQ